MIEGGWADVWASYAVACVAMAGLALVIVLHARHWAKRARELDGK
jgi:heme exporter protein D